MHRTDGLVEPRCNTIQGGQWRYKSRQIALVAGFYWQYNDDDAQLLNNAGIMQAVANTRYAWYKAIEAAEHNVDKATRSYQQDLRDQNAIDNWTRRNCEFVTDNVKLWSRYLLRHDDSAESLVSVPSQLPSSVAYGRCTRQRLSRPCG